MRWKKKEKCDHWQRLGARAAFILGAQRTESGSHCLNQGQEGIRARLQVGKGPKSQNGKPKDSDFLNLIVWASIRGDTEHVRQDKK